MTKKTLKELMETAKISNAVRLRKEFDEVEAALAYGLSLRTVYEYFIEKYDATWTFQAFKNEVYKNRKKLRSPESTPPCLPLVDNDENLDKEVKLTKKQERERNANEFVNPVTTNPLLKRVLEKNNDKNSSD